MLLADRSGQNGRLESDPVLRFTTHLRQSIEGAPFGLKTMPRVGDFESFTMARRSMRGFGAVPWWSKGLGFIGLWTINGQNRMPGFCFGCPVVAGA